MIQRACHFRDNVNEVALGTDTITNEFKNEKFYRTDAQTDFSIKNVEKSFLGRADKKTCTQE
jgi:hypothetical protein